MSYFIHASLVNYKRDNLYLSMFVNNDNTVKKKKNVNDSYSSLSPPVFFSLPACRQSMFLYRKVKKRKIKTIR
jgi:hypothetical protein